VLIALAHVALIAGLIRWSVAAKAPSNPESIVWLDGAQDRSADESEKQESPSTKQPLTEAESTLSKQNEAAEEKPVATTAKSEIELPRATPKPTATAIPAKPRPTPAVRVKPTPQKTVMAKASPKPATKPKSSPAKANAKAEKKDKITLAKNDTKSQSGSKKSESTGKDGSASGSSASEFAWYGNMLHDRFYSAWIQPTANISSDAKISTLVNVRIEKDGRVSKFEIIKPSGNATVNESVAAVANQVSQVDAPPTGLIKGDHYDVKINFELNTGEKPEN
jgi:TonB family protein